MGQKKEYQAYAYNEKLHGGRMNGTITISSAGIHFQAEKETALLPIKGAELGLGGASHRMVMIRHPSYPDWNITSRDRSLLTDPLLQNDPFVRNQLVRAKRRRIFNWSVAALVSFLLIAIPLILILNINSLSVAIGRQIPVAWEEQLGESNMLAFQGDSAVMAQDRSDPLLAPLADPLLAALEDKRYNFNFYIVNNEVLNAFALPGGYVVIHSGLIQAADSADEMLGVVAHEIAHVTEQHGLRNVINSAGIYVILTALLGDLSGLLGVITDASYLLLQQGYSRAFEAEADEIGHALLTTARVDPRGLASFFEKLLEVEQNLLTMIENERTREILETSVGFLSTHPATTDRIENLRAMWENDSRVYRDLDEPFRRLKAEVDKFVLETNGESTGDEGGN